MEDINETCQSIIDTMERIERQQKQFYENMMQLLDMLDKNTKKK